MISNTHLPAVRERGESFTLPPILYCFGVSEKNKETAVSGTLEVLLRLRDKPLRYS